MFAFGGFAFLLFCTGDGRKQSIGEVAVCRNEFAVQFFVVVGGAVFALVEFAVLLVRQRREYARITPAVEVAEYVGIRAVVAQSAAFAEEGYFIAFVEVLHSVGNHHYGAPFAGQVAEQVHHLEVEVGRKPARRFVEEDDFGVGEQFHSDGSAFALPARQRGYAHALASREAHVRYRLAHAVFHLVLEHRGAHTQQGGVVQPFRKRQVVVHYVALRHVAHQVLVTSYVLIIVVGVVIGFAFGGGAQPVHTVEQGGFSRAASSDDSHEISRFYSERYVVDNAEFAFARPVRDLFPHADAVDLNARGRGGIKQFFIVENVSRGRYGNAVVIVQFRPADFAVVHVSAVYRVQIFDKTLLSVINYAEMFFRHHRVVKHEVARRVTPDDRNRLFGEVEFVARAAAGDFAHGGNAHDVRVLFVPRLAHRDFVVETDYRAFEPLSVLQHFGFGALGGHILGVPHAVAPYATYLLGCGESRFQYEVARTFRAYDKLVFRIAVEKLEKFAVGDFENDIVHLPFL